MVKAVVALIMSALELIELLTGWSWTGVIDEQWIETLLMVLTPILVWLVPDDWPIRKWR